jgi:hypothetical protein
MHTGLTMIRNIKSWSQIMGSEIQKVIFNLEVIESEFRRNGFDKELGKDPALFVALANRLIIALEDLNNINEKQSVIPKKVRKVKVRK